jgi:hypothetical protein
VASIFQRGKKGIWWIKYYAAGQQVYHSLQTTSARTAERIKKQIEGEEVKGELLPPSRIPLPELLEDYCQFMATFRTAITGIIQVVPSTAASTAIAGNEILMT